MWPPPLRERRECVFEAVEPTVCPRLCDTGTLDYNAKDALKIESHNHDSQKQNGLWQEDYQR